MAGMKIDIEKVVALIDRLANRLPDNEGRWGWYVIVDEGYILIASDLSDTFHTYRNPMDWLTFTD